MNLPALKSQYDMDMTTTGPSKAAISTHAMHLVRARQGVLYYNWTKQSCHFHTCHASGQSEAGSALLQLEQAKLPFPHMPCIWSERGRECSTTTGTSKAAISTHAMHLVRARQGMLYYMEFLQWSYIYMCRTFYSVVHYL